MFFKKDKSDVMNSAKEGAMNLVGGKIESVKILGGGCAKCFQLEENVKKALDKVGVDVEIEHVTDASDIASYGVMGTPGLVVNGKVLSFGKVLNTEQILALLKK